MRPVLNQSDAVSQGDAVRRSDAALKSTEQIRGDLLLETGPQLLQPGRYAVCQEPCAAPSPPALPLPAQSMPSSDGHQANASPLDLDRLPAHEELSTLSTGRLPFLQCRLQSQ